MSSQKSLINEPGYVGVAAAAPVAVIDAKPVEQLPAVIDDDKPEALIAFSEVGVGMGVARRMATQLNDLIEKQKLFVEIKGKRFIFVEAWCACAAMCCLSPRTVWAKRIEDSTGKVTGYEARVEVVRITTGEVVGAAEAECWMDEKLKGYLRWTENHSAKAMAQTRATSRAIAQILRWIPVLAGYAGTPAEEMEGDGRNLVENPTQKPNAPQAQPRAKRLTATDIEALGTAFKTIFKDRPEDERDLVAWMRFVENHAMRKFDCRKASNWTEGDYLRVKAALEGGAV